MGRIGESFRRALSPADKRGRGRIYLGGEEYIDFSSNDYLGLSCHPRLVAAFVEAAGKFGTGASASRLLSGDLSLHHELEEKTAAFKGKEAALVFNSGYQANIGIIPSLCGRRDAVFSDRLAHASIIDGILLSGAAHLRFRHNDAGHLEKLLKERRASFGEALIVTESVFSMEGDRAPLRELVYLKEKYNCRIMVDEAHATGIFGPDGSGVVAEEGLTDEIDLIMGTFGKALGGFGAYLAASGDTIDRLINSCRSFIYSTALPPPVIAAGMAAIDVIKDEPHRRKILLANSDYLRSALAGAGCDVRGSSQIIPLITGGSEETAGLSRYLKSRGYRVMPIRPPTVPAGEGRLRFSLTYDHTKEILKGLIDDIRDIRRF